MTTLLSKCYIIGFGIAAIVSVPAYVMHWEINERKRNTEKIESLKQRGQHVYNLEKLVERRARIMYQEETKLDFFQRKENFKVDWADVKIVHDKPELARLLDAEEVNAELPIVLVRTVYKNDSKTVQDHKLTTTHTVLYGCESSLTKGYTHESDVHVNLTIPVPSVILDIGAGISKTFTIRLQDKFSEEQHYTWGVEDIIHVPQNSTMIVEKKTKEKESEYEFKTRMGFSGDVKGTFYNQKQQIIRTFTIPMKTIIQKEIPEDMIVKEEDKIMIVKGDMKMKKDMNRIEDIKMQKTDIDYIKVEGKIKYKYNVEHDVIIKSKGHSGCAIL